MVLVLVGLMVFISGCAKQKPTEVQFKNDLITVENFVVSDISPYENGEVTIEFDVMNNGDKPVSTVEVNFFDIPGFDIKQKDGQPQLFCVGGSPGDRKCTYQKLEPLDTRHITIKLVAKPVESPTPYRISFSVNYRCDFEQRGLSIRTTCMGSRQAIIPIIDGVLKKEPSFKFSQSDPDFGPIVIDIQPTLERTKVVGDKTIKEYWGTVGQTFTTKFVLRHVGKVEGKIKPVNILKEELILQDATGLNVIQNDCKDFVKDSGVNPPLPSQKTINETFNMLICAFQPTSTEPESIATTKVWYAYSYEFIRSVDFVVQPR